MKEEKIFNLDDHISAVSEVYRGEINIESYKFHYLSLVLLKSLSENNEHSFIVPEEAKWKNIKNQGYRITDAIPNAFFSLEKSNKFFENVFSFLQFEEINPTKLMKMVDLFNVYDFSDINNVSKVATSVLDLFIQREGAKSDIYKEPDSLSKLLVEILNLKKGTIYDGTAGTNDFLIKFYQQSDKSEVQLFAQEINKQTWALGKVMLALNGLSADKIISVCGDTLISPQFINENRLMQFDGILSSSPFGLKKWGEELAERDPFQRYKFGIPPKSSADWAFISHYIASLKNDGKAVLVVPHGALFRGAKEGAIRKNVIEEDLIEAVIGMPPNLLMNTTIPVAILILNKKKEKALKEKIIVIDAEGGFERERNKNHLREEDTKKILDSYINRKTIDEYSVIVDLKEIRGNQYNLLPMRYFDKIEVETELGNVKIFKDVYEKLNLIELKELASMRRGINLSPKDIAVESGNVKTINLSDIDNEDEIDFTHLKDAKISRNQISEYSLTGGDILISSRGTRNTKVVIVPETDKDLIYSNNFIRLRINDKKKWDPHYIKFFLDGPIGQYYLKASQTGSMVSVLSAKDIEKIEIPVLAINQQKFVAGNILKSQHEYKTALKIAKQKKEAAVLESYSLMGIKDSFQLIKERGD